MSDEEKAGSGSVPISGLGYAALEPNPSAGPRVSARPLPTFL